jgi:hypothetical protein
MPRHLLRVPRRKRNALSPQHRVSELLAAVSQDVPETPEEAAPRVSNAIFEFDQPLNARHLAHLVQYSAARFVTLVLHWQISTGGG